MSRSYMYQRLADDLRARVARGDFGRGQVLPTEAELGAQYGASRLTVRRALGMLRDERLLQSRRGFGWFVSTLPVQHTLGQLGTIEQQVAKMGRTPRRQIRHFGFERAPEQVAQALGTKDVLHIDRLNTADDEAIAHSWSWIPATLAAGLSLEQVSSTSLYELLPIEIGGARQRISAIAASEADAELLGTPVGAPCLRSERVVHTVDGTPAVYAVAVFAAHRTEFLVELARESDAAASMQLVDAVNGARPRAGSTSQIAAGAST